MQIDEEEAVSVLKDCSLGEIYFGAAGLVLKVPDPIEIVA
jgi:hypothetical protein